MLLTLVLSGCSLGYYAQSIGGQRDLMSRREPIESYLACQHSRASLSQEALGPKLSERFDRELQRILKPYSRSDRIRYELRTRIEWASPADA